MDDKDKNGFINSGHASQALQRMDQFLRNKQLCDVTLIAGNRRIPAHRLVLCSLSDYFASMFTHDLCEAKKNEIEIHEVNPDSLMWLIRYMYTSHIDIREDNVEDLLITSRLLQINNVVEACCKYLKLQLHPSNCLGIAKFADSQSCLKLYHDARSFAFREFIKLPKYQEFLELEPNELEALLKEDDLSVPNEKDVFEALVTWLEYKVESRVQYFPTLLEWIRLGELDMDYLCYNVEESIYVRENPKAQRMIIDTMKMKLTNKTDEKCIEQGPRRSTLGFLVCVGGLDASKGCNTIEVLDPLSPLSWENAGSIQHKRVQFGVAVMDDKLFIVGGRDGYKTLNSVECFNLNTKSWQSMPPLSTHRHGVGVVLLEGPLYAIGGNDGWSFLNTVERWDSQVRSWNYVAPMNTPRSTHGVSVVGKKIMVIGGRDVSSCLRSVEAFDPNFNRWTYMAPMNKRRGGLGVAVLKNFVFAVGGLDSPSNSKAIAEAEKYDTQTDQWTILTPQMNLAREGVSCGVLGDTIYVIGGYDGKSYLRSVECLRPFDNEPKWEFNGNLVRARATPSVLHVTQKFSFEVDTAGTGEPDGRKDNTPSRNDSNRNPEAIL